MSKFIDPKNQTLLWQTIQKHPYTVKVFPPGYDQNKIQWFKNNISEIYNQNQTTILSNEQLLELNKIVLRKMIEEMRQTIQPIETPTVPPLLNNNNNNNNNNNTLIESDRSYSRESILQDKTTIFQRDLENRQKEYEQLFQKPTPPPLEFEKSNDSVINNMDELIARQLRERENDLKQISQTLPKPPIMNETKNIDTTNIFQKQKPLNIRSEIDENIKIDILELPQKKQVSWDMSDALESKIEELTQKYTKLLDFLEKNIPNFQKEFSQYDSEISIATVATVEPLE
jgi:hypothetical protein